MRGHGEGTILTRKRRRKDGSATIGFEPMHRGFADAYPYPSGVPATLRSGSLRGGLTMVLVCRLVCA